MKTQDAKKKDNPDEGKVDTVKDVGKNADNVSQKNLSVNLSEVLQ